MLIKYAYKNLTLDRLSVYTGLILNCNHGLGRVEILYFAVGRVALAPGTGGSNWVGSDKSDP